MEQQKKSEKFSATAMPAEKKLFIIEGDSKRVAYYDFAFAHRDSMHYMIMSEDKVYVLEPNCSYTAKVKLVNDVLMVLNSGCYDYVRLGECPVHDVWMKAYAFWRAEEEIFND